LSEKDEVSETISLGLNPATAIYGCGFHYWNGYVFGTTWKLIAKLHVSWLRTKAR